MGHVTRVNSLFRHTGDRIFAFQSSDVESDDYSESGRSYELGKVDDFACARPRPDFSAFSSFSAFGARLQLAGRCDRSDSSFRTYVIYVRKTDGGSLLLKIVGPVRAAIRRKVQVRKVREKPGGRLFTTFTDVLRPLTSLDECKTSDATLCDCPVHR